MNKGNQRGITLIALIITIIVILILVAVSVRTISKSGLFEHAKDATNKWADEQKKEGNIGDDIEQIIKDQEYGEIVEDPNKHYVARINKRKYETIQEAFDAVKNNNQETEVVLITNIEEVQNGKVESGKNVVLKLDNYSALINLENEGTLKIINGEIVCQRDVSGEITNKGTMIIENLKDFNRYVISNEGTLNMKDINECRGWITNVGNATITNMKSSMHSYPNFNSFSNEGTIKIKDSDIGEFELRNSGEAHIENSALQNDYPSILANEGTITCENVTFDLFQSTGAGYRGYFENKNGAEITMTGGSISGTVGGNIFVNEGKLTLSGELPLGNITSVDYCIVNLSTGNVFINSNVQIKCNNTALKNEGGNIYVTGGKIQTYSKPTMTSSSGIIQLSNCIVANNLGELDSDGIEIGENVEIIKENN